MRRIAATLALIVVIALPASAAAAPLSATQILDQRAKLDGQQVALIGEAIGDVLHADEGDVWLNVLSDGTALGVYLPAEMADAVHVLGDYRHAGDIVLVTGEYRRACDQHGGDMDIHATALEVVAPGSVTERPIEFWKFGLAGFGLVLTGASVLYARYKRRVTDGA
ncbi:MAG: hypothetical protein CVT66_11260 [Actinobacteria bacterium HGW-Actinobacteria-6]|jgi:hypothetical protein|nr:MAG: hypothetical protein CVT66_11260 [Actinobacteria bacterium HGW-Actinobacteria-6]